MRAALAGDVRAKVAKGSSDALLSVSRWSSKVDRMVPSQGSPRSQEGSSTAQDSQLSTKERTALGRFLVLFTSGRS